MPKTNFTFHNIQRGDSNQECSPSSVALQLSSKLNQINHPKIPSYGLLNSRAASRGLDYQGSLTSGLWSQEEELPVPQGATQLDPRLVVGCCLHQVVSGLNQKINQDKSSYNLESKEYSINDDRSQSGYQGEEISNC